MGKRPILGKIVMLAIGLAGLVWGGTRWYRDVHTASNDPLPAAPRRILWAWERPEDLRFLDPSRTGVAFLSATVWLEHDRFRVEPRHQTLRLPPGIFVMSVVRIQTLEPALSDAQLESTADELLHAAHLQDVTALQIDFDARRSERDFYRRLIARIRPQVSKLSITALASWCLDDPWIRDLAIDEAVPMLFRMGTDDAIVRRQLAAGRRFPVKACGTSAGVSTDEALPALPPLRRVYVFTPTLWSRASYDALSWNIRSLP
jgi:hypothetical protein